MFTDLPPLQDVDPPAIASRPALTAPPAPRLNGAGRDIHLSGPLKDGDFIVGEVSYLLTADGRILVDAGGFLALMQGLLSPEAWAELAESAASEARIPAETLRRLGYPVAYDPATFGLSVTLDPARRQRRNISLSGASNERQGPRAQPAAVSGYVTGFLTADYVHVGPDAGMGAPNLLIDSAVRVRSVVLETEATFADGFSREGTRLVYDDARRNARWTAGDLRPQSRGFSGASPMAGLSLERVYADLDPHRVVQPRGQQSFTLARPSTVEVLVNGRSVAQTRLTPGSYDISDFPFAQGGNDVRLVLRDDTGAESVISFSVRFDRSLLEAGLAEFGLYAGVGARASSAGRTYSGDPAASGFYRRGLTDSLTAGASFRAGGRGGVVAGEAVWAAPVGTLGLDLAASSVDGIGQGFALNLGYERMFGAAGGQARSLSATFQAVSEGFAGPDAERADNPFAFQAGLTYAQTLGQRRYLSADVFYAVGRGDREDFGSARVTYGWRVSDRATFSAEAEVEQNHGRTDVGLRLGLSYQLGRFSGGSIEADTRRERARLTYQTAGGRDVGAWNASGSLDATAEGAAVNAYFATRLNRAELGGAHITAFDAEGGGITDQRTTLRAGASLAFADGAFAVSRPIHDGFVLFRPHRTLGDAPVYVAPHAGGYSARSGRLGGAVASELSAHSARSVTYDAPDAPTGYDLGVGLVQVLPPYRAGYLVTVGSDYSVSAIGQLLGRGGDPAGLQAGLAHEVGRPDTPPVRMFTNATGRFSVQALRPGRWRIELESGEAYAIHIPDDAEGLVRLGVLTPDDSR